MPYTCDIELILKNGRYNCQYAKFPACVLGAENLASSMLVGQYIVGTIAVSLVSKFAGSFSQFVPAYLNISISPSMNCQAQIHSLILKLHI